MCQVTIFIGLPRDTRPSKDQVILQKTIIEMRRWLMFPLPVRGDTFIFLVEFHHGWLGTVWDYIFRTGNVSELGPH